MVLSKENFKFDLGVKELKKDVFRLGQRKNSESL